MCVNVCRTAAVRSRRNARGEIDEKSWLTWVAFNVAMRYVNVFREET